MTRLQLGFKTKLTLALAVMTIASLLITGLFSHSMLKQQVNQRILGSIDASLSKEVDKIESMSARTVDTVKALAQELNSGNNGVAKEKLMHLAVQLGGIQKVIVGFDDGSSFTSRPSESFPNGVGIKSKYDPTERPWYITAKRQQGLSLSDVFFTKNTKTPMVGAMYNLGNGVILADIRFTDLQQKLEEIEAEIQAKSFILDGNGLVIASTLEGVASQLNIAEHPHRHEVNQSIKQPAQFVEVKLDVGEHLLVAKPVELYPGTTWQLVVAMDKQLALQDLNSASKQSLLITFAAVGLSLLVVIALLHKLYQPILSLKNIVSELAKGNGDLTQRLAVKSKDDLGQIAMGINQFIDGLQSMLKEVHQASGKLSAKTRIIEQACQSTRSTLETHTNETTQIVAAVEELSNASVEVEAHTHSAASSTQLASQYSDETKGLNQLTQRHIIELESQVENTSHDIEQMADESQSIQSIVNVIGSIAEQTNLLALNASIEAARAGEHGRGFAVVADEVRALANRTQVSTSEIEEALGNLQRKSESLVASIDQTKHSCEETREQVDKAVSRLNTLDEQIETINRFNAEISTFSSEQNTVIQSINSNIHQINDLVVELNGLSDEQVAESDEIRRLNEQVEGLIGRFRV